MLTQSSKCCFLFPFTPEFVLLFLNSGGRPRRRMVIVASTPATKAEWLTLLNRHINVAKGMLGSPMLNDGHV
jgi:hypothetical protein